MNKIIQEKSRRVIWLTSLMCLLWALPVAAQLRGDGELIDRIVAVVNEDVVLASELEIEGQKIARKLSEAGGGNVPQASIREQALERLIMLKLQLAEAEKLGIEVNEETLARAVGNVARRNNMSISQLRDALQAEGLNFESFREDLRQRIVLSQLRNREVVSRIQVTRAEVDRQLKQTNAQAGRRSAVHLLHLLIATPDGASPAEIQRAKSKAEGLLQQLQAGADFRTLAQQESDGRQALNGGDLGWLNADRVPSLFAGVIHDLARGDIAGPLRSSSGFHLIKLEDYRGSDRSIVVQTLARHILVRTDELTSDTEAEQRLERLRERLVGGDDFETLARSHSDDKASAIKGGSLGWVNQGDMVAQFEEVMNSLEPGEVSEPFRTEFGWHVMQVQERRQHDATGDLLRNKAREVIRDRKADAAMEQYLRRLRDEAFVDIRLDDASR